MSRPLTLLPLPVAAAPAEAGDAARLVDHVEARRAEWRRQVAAEAGLLALVVFLGATVVSAWVLAGLSAAASAAQGVLWAGGLAGLGAAAWVLVSRLRGSRHLGRWAARLAAQERHADHAEFLRSALEIAAASLQRGSARLPAVVGLGSPQLVQLTLAQAGQHVATLELSRQRLRNRLRRYGFALMGATAAWAATALAAPATWREFVDPSPSVAPPPRAVGTLVGDTRLRIDPPPYAKARVDSREEETAEATVLRGSRIQLDALPLPDQDVREVEIEPLEAAPGTRTETVRLEPGPGGALRWSRTAMEPSRYRYRGLDDEGLPVREAAWRTLQTRRDAAPRADIRTPSEEIEVRAGQSVTIEGEVSDDLGLSLVNLVIARPASGVERRPVALAPSDVLVEVREKIAVDTLQLRPGEVALVNLEAADNNPLDGNQRASSDKLRIRMYSAERHHAGNLDAMAQLTEFWAFRLADRLELDPTQRQADLPWALRNRGELAEQEQRGLEDLRTLRLQLTEDLLSRAKTVADLLELEQLLGDHLADETRVSTRIVAETTGYAAVRDLYALQRQHALVLASQEHAVTLLAALASAEHQGALARDGATLADAERQLMATLEKLAEAGTPPLSSEAERLLDNVEQQLDRMAAAAQKQMRIVPYEHINQRGIDATGLNRDLGDHRQALAEVRQLLRAGKGREALDRMRQIQQAMAGVLGDVQQGVDRQRTAEEEALGRLVADLRRSISRAQQGEGRLRDDLRHSSEDQERATADHLRAARQTLLPGVVELIQGARDDVRPQRLATALLHGHRGLAGARAALATALGALDLGQIDATLQALMEAEDLLMVARRTLAEAEETEEAAANRRSFAADGRRLDVATEKAQRASQKLRDALPSPQSLLPSPTRQRLDQNAMQQEQVRHALDKARQRLSQGGRAHPALQRQVGDRLDHALQTMRETQDALQRYDAQRAFQQTAETLDALDRAAAMLENQGDPRDGQSPAAERVGADGADGEVQLRSGNQSDAVETFRQDVLRAMQHRAPGAWRDRLQQYYKAIGR
jgi:hypothetical protein